MMDVEEPFLTPGGSVLDKLNQIHPLAKSTIAEDITFIKNTVNSITQPSTRALTWAEKVKSGGPQTKAPIATPITLSVSSKEREIIVKLDNTESAIILRQKTPEELRHKINDTL
ncbi:hypothetical protein G7Y89_g12458 [Cudoniella acicularis]|uniref:Uncharacterized protein n=1 Tax=Cudoniella acicularis TaxID=354080 RepID=A0A8H4VX01_9HELO|nr:hypothetical protein G7Y89_g12458 [Cudoniella acicularis]